MTDHEPRSIKDLPYFRHLPSCYNQCGAGKTRPCRRLFSNPRVQSIFEVLGEGFPLNARQLSAKTGVSVNSLLNLLARLKRDGLVSCRPYRGMKYYSSMRVQRRALEVSAASWGISRHRSTGVLYEALRSKGPLNVSRIAEHLEISPGHAEYIGKRLVGLGWAVRIRKPITTCNGRVLVVKHFMALHSHVSRFDLRTPGRSSS